MLKHNLLIIIRNIKSNKSSYLINLIGLSTGLACALFIYLWVNDELQVDKFNKNDSQLYQVMQNYELPNEIVTWDYTPGLLADELLKEMPEVKAATRLNSRYTQPKGMLTFGENHFRASGKYASKGFFEVFSYNILQGNPDQFFADKNGIILSETLAKKIFNNSDNIIGQTVIGNQDLHAETFRVTGIFQNPPTNARDQFDFILNFDLLQDKQSWVNRWESDPAETYLVFKDGTNIRHFEEKIAGLLRTKTPSREPSTLFLQQYSKRYLYGSYENGKQVGGRIAYVKLFSIIAIFIVVIACINFMNLSTAKASTRMKEISVKKAVGANRNHLVFQYLLEAILISFISLIIALLLVKFLTPQFNLITGKHLGLHFNLQLLLSVVGITLLTGIISGSYPAFYLSAFSPINILKGKIQAPTSELWIRKGLVIFQFALTLIFTISFLIINKQIEFTQNKNLGYNRNNVLSFQWQPTTNNDLADFITRIQNVPGVEHVSNMFGDIMNEIYIESGYSWRGLESDKGYAFKNLKVGNNFFETLDIEIVQGRSFSSEFNDDYTKIILNEAALHMMGLENPVGQVLQYGSDGDSRQIIGIIKNFHYGSLYNKVEPLVISYASWGRKILVKLNAGTERATIARLDELYKKVYSGFPFTFTFLDDEYATLYESEQKVAMLSKYFSGLAILISCLGLFGLTTFSAQRRQKEIGIRKSLGSTVFGIVLLLCSDFLKWIIISNIIAWPLAWFAMNKWLQNFAYKIDLTVWPFLIAGFSALFIAMITVSFQTIKAALANPVKSLRYE